MASIKKIKLPNGTEYDIKDSGALPLTGGTVTGPVIFQDTTSMDEATIGDLVVNGNASFTNNIQANTINGGAVGNNPKFTDTITTATTTGSGNAVTAITASNGAITVTKGTTFLTSHQDISGKADKTETVSNVAYDSTNAKITKTINGTTSDVVTVATLKSALGSMPASDVYSWAKASNKPTYTASEVGAATSGHTHSTTLATDTGTSSITLASAGKYKLTAGGNSVIFTMPTIPTVSYPVTSVNSKTGAVSLTYSDVDAAAESHTHTKSEITDFPTSMTPTSHSHGNITNAGDITATAPTIASGDQLVINDHSASKITNGPTFDGSTTTQALTKAGTWATFGTSNLTIGTTASTAAAGNHTHSASLATSTGTSSITLEHGAKYSLTAGGSSVIFTMPTAASNSDTKVTQAYSTANNSYPVLFSATAGVSSTSSRGETTSILNNAIYANPSTGNLQVTKLNSYTPGAAMAKAVDTSISAGSTSANLPTSSAVASFVEGKGYITSYTDTKNTAGATDTSSRIYLIGATSQGANPQTYSQDTAYVGTDGCLYSNNSKVALASHTHTLGEEVYTPGTGEAMFKISPGNSYKFSVDSASFKFSVESANATTDIVGSASLGTAIPADDITAWSAGTVPSLTVTSTSVVTSATVSGTTLTLGTGTVGSASGWSAGTAPSLSYTAKSIPNVSVTNKTVVTGIS